MTKKIFTIIALTTISSTGFAFAQSEGPGVRPEGMPPGPPIRQEYRQEIKNIKAELYEERKEIRGEFREGLKERREWNLQNASGTATGTKPTPFKDLREDMKGARKEFKEDMKGVRDEMRSKMQPLSATATAAIAAKLGITSEALNAQLASGTKLKEIVKGKLTPAQMKEILPPRIATFTKKNEDNGFVNRIFSNFFGQNKTVFEERVNEFGEITISTSTISVPSSPFWLKFFNF